jgi:hypothetical protein
MVIFRAPGPSKGGAHVHLSSPALSPPPPPDHTPPWGAIREGGTIRWVLQHIWKVSPSGRPAGGARSGFERYSLRRAPAGGALARSLKWLVPHISTPQAGQGGGLMAPGPPRGGEEQRKELEGRERGGRSPEAGVDTSPRGYNYTYRFITFIY